MIKIDKDIPVPTKNYGDISQALRSLEIGDSFFIIAQRNNIASICSSIGKTTGKKFKTGTEGDGFRVWRIK